MKKLFATCLAAALVLSMSGGALAATVADMMPYDTATNPVIAPYLEDTGELGSDARLAAVTLKIKNVLDLDTEGYEEFSGNLSESGLVPTWNLYWSGSAGSLSISASEEGEILSLYRYEYDYYRDPLANAYGPRYPKDNSAAALAAAGAFVARLLDPAVESVKLAPNRYQTYPRPVSDSGSWGEHSFSSTIYLNGLPSPLSLRVSVREDGTVVNFSRDILANKYIGDLAAAVAAASPAEARAALRDTLEMELEYIPDDDGETAILRYLPVSGDQYFVTGDGKLVNLSELMRGVTEIYSNYRGAGPVAEAAADMSAGGMLATSAKQLSETELKGVEKLEGVLTKEELTDALIAAYPELGLDGFTLSGANYSVARGKETEGVDCTLTFSRKMGDGIQRRTVTANAKTAVLSSVYTSYPRQSEGPNPVVGFAAAEGLAEAFLSARFADEFGGSEQTSSNNAAEYSYGIQSHSFDYTRKVNGYFFRNNSLSVGIDPTDGTVAALYRYWDNDMTFASPEGIVSLQVAIDAYLDAYLCNLQYIAVPAAIDGSAEYKALMEMGYSYFYTMMAGYQLDMEENTWFGGVNAADGTAVIHRNEYEVTPLAYDDLGTSWAKSAIERLAAHNVGYAGGSFQPAKALTQLDLLTLLVSTGNGVYDLSEENAAQNVYNAAYNMGLLRKEERSDNKVLTRMEMTRLILDASGYGRVAQLPGIFVASFSDADQIPAALYGYAAVAEGLGIMRGNSTGACMPMASATRAEAAAMLDQFMSR